MGNAYFGIVCVLVLVLAGCSTSMHGSAPAKDGFYAVGSKVKPFVGEQPEVWLCPSTKGGACHTISVVTEEK